MTPFLGQDACIAIERRDGAWARILGCKHFCASVLHLRRHTKRARKRCPDRLAAAGRRDTGRDAKRSESRNSAMKRGCTHIAPLRCRWRGRARGTAEARQPAMSALGQKRTFRNVWSMSASPPKADIRWCGCDVRFVPMADIRRAFSRDGFPSIPTVPHRSSSTRRPPKEQCR